MTRPSIADLADVGAGWDPDPRASSSLGAAAYVDPAWQDLERDAVFANSWQWVCHLEAVRSPGDYVATTVAGQPVAVVRDGSGDLRAFSNVCRHRAHEVLSGAGNTRRITCPYHAWVYDLDGTLRGAPHTGDLLDFEPADICLPAVRVEEFSGFAWVNLDPDAGSLAGSTGALVDELARWAPDVDGLTHAHRLTYRIASDWKNVVDNFLECYHCPVAHKDFCTLVDMPTYEVGTDGIWSWQYAEAGKEANAAYDVADATVRMQTVWWLWPNTCLLRFPGRGNFMVLQILPDGPGRTYETLDVYLESPEPNEAEWEAVRFLDEVLQVEDIAIVESIQRGMATPGFDHGRIVVEEGRTGRSEHAVHHFHGLLLEAYGRALTATGGGG